jgi:hypothetical protein
MTTKARLVAAAEPGVVTAAAGQGWRVAVAHRAEQILAQAAGARWRRRILRAG